MDVHKDSITIAVYVGQAEKPREVVRLANEPAKLRRYVGRLAEQGEIRACYEASGAGFVLERSMREWGYACAVIAPSLIPQRAGVRRKHDRYDACALGRLYRSGELVEVRVPSAAEERVRDVVRCRARFQKEILQSRHSILKFLARRDLVYREGKHHWTKRHWEWLRALLRPGVLAAEDHLVLSEYIALLEFKLSRRDELDRWIEAQALEPYYQERVAALRCFRGLDTHAAMVLASEIGDFRRFARAEQLMSYLGLIPSEHSSGERHRRGSITKAGNSHCRHALVQAAWSYCHPPRLGAALQRRQQGASAQVAAHAWKAQQRLHKLWKRVSLRRGAKIAVVAVARELVGFIWAVMREAQARTELQSAAAQPAAA
ncbi:MAG TPA: IS110 family transposase [Longimicrobiaceae bacterium]|nr:IS110 family transposase [Longimicrobiaceae bacterium]